MSTALNAARVKLVPWWLVLIEGILLIILGIFLLTNPAATFVTIIWVLGLYWLISGIFNIIKIFFDSSMWGWKIFAGIVGIIAGWFLIQHPISGSVVVSTTTVILLGLFGIFIGIVNLIQAFRGAGWGTGILGIASIILGFILLANRLLFTFSLPWTLGVLMIIGGIISIFNAFRLRGAKHDLEDAADAAAARMSSAADATAARTQSMGAAAVGAAGAAAAAAKDKTDDAADAAGAAMSEAADTLEDAADDAVDTVGDAADAAGDTMGQAADTLEDAVDEAAETMGEATDNIEEAGARLFGIDVDPGDDVSAEIAEKYPNLTNDQRAKVARLVAAVRSLSPEDAEKLRAAGLVRSEDLLERGATRQGRTEISNETGIDASLILKWVNELDLKRVKGIGVKYSNLLETAGVDTVMELAQRNPQNLLKKLEEVNETADLAEVLPSEDEVADWVAQAKELPRVITY